MHQNTHCTKRIENATPRIWDAVSDEKVCVAGVAELYRQVDQHQFEMLRNPSDISSMEESFKLSFFGKDQRAPIAYAAFLTFEAQPLSEIFLDEDSVFDSYFDQGDRPVRPKDVREFDGFDQYSREGGVLYLDKFEVAAQHQGKGFGGTFLQGLISWLNPELVFLHARDDNAREFFLHQGFDESGIVNGDLSEPVLVARNPSFSRNIQSPLL